MNGFNKMENAVSKTALNKITAAFIGAENKTAELIEAIKQAGGVAEKAVIRHLYILHYCRIKFGQFSKMTSAMELGAQAWIDTKAKERDDEGKTIYTRAAKRISRFLADNDLVSENNQGQGRKKGEGAGKSTKAKSIEAKPQAIAKVTTATAFNEAVMQAAMQLLTFSEKNDDIETPAHELILDFVGGLKDALAD